MKWLVSWTLMLGFICCVSGVASATSDVIVYPKEDQSKDQQEKDEFECYKWAKERTGYDPSKPASGSTAEKAEEPAKEDAAAAGGLGSLSGKGGALGAGVAAAGGRHASRGDRRESRCPNCNG